LVYKFKEITAINNSTQTLECTEREGKWFAQPTMKLPFPVALINIQWGYAHVPQGLCTCTHCYVV